VPDAFNPYREWLGLSGGRRPANHYELLGVDLCEGDRAVIAQAADAMTARIRSIRPGAHMTEWQQLLGSLAEAKQCLLDPGAKAAYDAVLRGQAMPGQPAPPPSQKVIPLGPVQPVSDPVASARPAVPEDSFPPEIAGASRHRRTGRRATPSVAQMGVYGLTVVFFAMAVVFGYALYQRQQKAAAVKPPTPETGVTPETGAPTGLAQRPSVDDPAPEKPTPSGGTASGGETKPDPKPAPMPREDPASGERPKPDEPPKPEDNPQPAKTTEPDSPAERQRREAVARALADARSSMSEHNVPSARGFLRSAAERATTPEEEAEVDRLDTLQGHLEEFWKGMSRAVARLQGGEELKIGDTYIAVVEASSEELTVKAAGQVRTYPIGGMPFRLVEELADLKLGKDPATKVLVGTYHLVDPKGDPARASRLWEEAGQGGLDVKDLLPELTAWAKDPTASGTAKTGRRPPLGSLAGTPPPTDTEELKRAEEEVKATFKAEYDAATSMPGKSRLATALLEAGEAMRDDPTARFVLLREAREAAVAAGEGELACRAIDATSAFHKADVLEMKRTALAAAAKKARGLEGQRQIAETALELVQEAVVAERLDEAEQLAKVALSAARKMNSRPLMQQAMVAGQQVEALRKQGKQ